MDPKTVTDDVVTYKDKLLNIYGATVGIGPKDIAALTYILQKSFKIVQATLLVTGLLDRTLAMRTEIEQTAMRLVKDAALSGRSATSRRSLVEDLLVLCALLEAAALADELSRNNTDLLVMEANLLAGFLQDIRWHQGRSFLDASLLDVAVPEEVFAQDVAHEAIRTYKGHGTDAHYARTRTEPASSDRYVGQQRTVEEGSSKRQYRERVQDVQKDRRATILGMLQRKDRVSVRDVAGVIKDCSEKTLQRELLALVAQGVLKKEGERRWSTYRLA
jgi:hypothetical protein